MVSNPEARRFTAYGAPLEILQKRYGGLMRAQTFDVSVLLDTPLVPADPERVFIAFKADPTVGSVGVWIAPILNASEGFDVSNLFLQFDERNHGLMPTLAWFGASTFAGQTLRVLTVRRDVVTGEVQNY